MTRAQLLGAGVSRHVIDRQSKSGALHRRHRGVYVVGHLALAPHANEAAALLACGQRSLISHRSAAYLWGLSEHQPAVVDVTLVGRRCRPKDGVRLHNVSTLDPADIRNRAGLPVTSPARTLVDLAADATYAELDRGVSEARIKGLLRNDELQTALERAGRRHGTAMMRAFLRSEDGRGFTRSEAERRTRALLRQARLPVPRVNARVAGYEIDFLWEPERVIVEVDGYAYHGNRRAFERDRRKDLALTSAGYLVIRISWRQLDEEPFVVVAHVARALERAARTAG